MGESLDDRLLYGFIQMRQLLEENKVEEFCQSARALLIAFNTDEKEKFANQITELRNRTDNKIYDSTTVELAECIIDNRYNVTIDRIKKKREEYLEKVQKQIEKYAKLGRTYRIIHRALQAITYIGAASLLILNSVEIPREIITLVSTLVAAAVALSSLYKLEERVTHYHRAVEKLQQELSLYKSDRKPYAELMAGGALDTFMDKVDELQHELSELSLGLDKTSQNVKIEEMARMHKKD